MTQGLTTPTLKSAEKVIERTTPAPSYQDIDTQEVDWPDAIQAEIPSQSDQQNDQSITFQSTRHNLESVKIPQLEENLEEEQYLTYLTHHNMFEVSQHIRRDYRSGLLTLDDEKYYEEVDRALNTYGTPAAQDYRPANQASGPCRTTQELMQIFGKGRGQARREELHGHRPFGARTRLLQSYTVENQKDPMDETKVCQRPITFMYNDPSCL